MINFIQKPLSVFFVFIFTISIQQSIAQGCQTETTQADFLAGTGNNLDLTTSPGDIKLPAAFLDQQNTTLGTSGVGITTTNYGGQTFTPSVSGTLTQISINLFCSGCTGTTPNIIVEIRATSANLPTGAALASSTITGFSSNTSTDYTSVFATPAALTAGTKYAIIVRPAVNPSPGTYALTRSGTSTAGADVYAGGTRVTGATSGTVWSIPLTGGVSTDAGFKTFMSSTAGISGDFTSQVKNAGAPALWSTLSFTNNVPANTNIKFQVAASNAVGGPYNFVGPDGTSATFFTSSGASLSQFSNLQYIKYKAFLSTLDGTVLPTLNDVTLCYSSVLGVHWLNITGNLSNQNHAVINWQVEENNTAVYEVERSIDGIVFTNIGQINSTGNGTKTYQFTDAASLPATAFYRIKQVDRNGRFSYSSVVKLSNRNITALSIYPNPTTALVTITAGSSLLHTKAILLDVKGNNLYSFSIENLSTTIDMTTYPTGIYMLKLVNGTVQKIIKQ